MPERKLTEHLWILTKLLSMKPFQFYNLMKYIVATCCRKMIHRFTHPVSKMYIESLKSVGDIPLNESLLERSIPDADAAEKSHDEHFLCGLYILWKKNLIKFPIPALVKQAERAMNRQDFRVYSAETYLEFHRLILALLELYREALQVLSTSPAKLKGTSERPFEEWLRAAVFCGLALHNLTRGAALRIHLKNIEDRLHFNPDVDTKSRSVPNEREDEGREAEDKGREEDLEAVDPSVHGVDLCEFYWKWFRLLLVHFQAAEILTRYVSEPRFQSGTPISIRILSPPQADDKLLPWQELFADEKFLPPTSVRLGNTETSNAEILNILTEGTWDILKWSSAIKAAKEAWANDKLNETIELIALLKSSPLPGWGTTAERLLCILQEPIEYEPDITDMIHALSDSTWLFTCLSNCKFKGALHCEASLASLISLKNAPNTHPDSQFAGLLAEVKVIMCFQLVLAIAYLYIHSVPDQLSGYPSFAARHVKNSWKS
jgi:hypothetical protein